MDWKSGFEAIDDGEKAEEEGSGREKGFAAAAAAEAAEGDAEEGAAVAVAASAGDAFVRTM